MSEKKNLDLCQPDDSYEMRNLIAWCSKNGFVVRRASLHHIKIGPWNCWPSTGRFNHDEFPTPRRGMAEFLGALTKWQAAKAAIFEPKK